MMMSTSINFQPLFPLFWLAVILTSLASLTLVNLALRKRGSILRFLAFLALVIALFNPVFLNEEREPLKSVVALIIDRSQSQNIGQRRPDTDSSVKWIKEKFARLPQFDLRIIEAGHVSKDEDGTSTQLFHALNGALYDIPPSRIAGVIMITDGEIHDISKNIASLGFNAPIHGLITGMPDEIDRQIRFVHVPHFGMIHKAQKLIYKVSDVGSDVKLGSNTHVQIFINGNRIGEEKVVIGAEMSIEVMLPHIGTNIVEIRTDPLLGEVTQTNNRAIAIINGIRENLRVLLISGEPHNGERTWRNLLKSDASVELVHFTILRPPEKQDETPINELSLIAFPIRELFIEKIKDFDLIIFDRYQNRDALSLLYYDYIAEYVENGGALLIVAGAEYAGEQSIVRTPLLNILPALPTGTVIEKAFYPRLTETGKRHPVTRGLEGSVQEPPQWSRWFRIIDIGIPKGEVVMSGADNKPLLVLSRVGQGRIGMFLSDQSWLWARGFEGGGPYATLYRRIAHWLMKEPELEEEALTASGFAHELHIRRQTMNDNPGKAKIITPSGQVATVSLNQIEPGIFSEIFKTDESGLFQIANGNLNTLAYVGPLNAPEFTDSISTTMKLKPLTEETGGSVRRLHTQENQNTIKLPDIITVNNDIVVASGKNWIGLREKSNTTLKSINHLPILSGFLGLAIILFIFGAMWYREGR